MNNGVLPVTVSDEFLQKIFIQKNQSSLTINLEQQTIKIDTTGKEEQFEINSYKKECLLNGFDDIDYLLSIKDDIIKFENQLV